MATASVLGADVPQAVVTVTETVPPVAPAVAVIEAVVDVPVHPPGKVQA